MRMAVASGPTIDQFGKQAATLLSLAKDKSPSARAALVNQLCDLCFAGATLSAAERQTATSLLLLIFGHANVDVRMSLADRLSRDPLAPRELVLAIANDDASVAFAVLAESPVLSDEDLVAIVRAQSPEHRLGVAQRDVVGAAITDALVETGDPCAMRWVLENPGSEISRASMETIVEAARCEDQLHHSLGRREDIPADLVPRLPERLAPAPREESIASPADEEERRVRAAATDLRDSGELTVDRMLKTLRAGKLSMFEVLLASYCMVSTAAMRRVIASSDWRGLASVCKAIGIDKATFAAIAMLVHKARNPGANSPSNMMVQAAAAFDGIGAVSAADALARLQAAHPEAASAI
jgi:uncharacterized protein (DUF2336 family)